MLHRFWPALLSTAFVILVMSAPLQSAELSPGDESTAQEVIRDQLSAFQSQDHDRAFSHAAPTIKEIFGTTERFVGMVKGGYAPLYNPETFSFGRSRLEGQTVYQEVFVTDQKGKQWQAVYSLEQQADGTWKITGVQMEPYNGAAT